MPETLFDPTIHQSAEPLIGYRFDHEALVARLNELKKAPSEDMKAFLMAHPEYKSFNCTALAEYAGLSEPTLKKLKAGQIADPRGSTFWILFNKFGIRPREVLKCIPPGICNIECANQAKLKLDEVLKQSLADQEELARLRKLLLKESNSAVAAQAQSDSKDAQILRRDKGIKMRNKLIFILIAFIIALFIADMFIPNVGWFRFGLLK